jgi:cell division protein FtsQ
VPSLSRAGKGAPTLVETLDRVLGRVLRPLADLLPRRLRRMAEKLEQQRRKPAGAIAAGVFLLITILYGLTVSGQIGRVGDALLIVAGFGIDDVKITGAEETSQITILEKLGLDTSLIGFDVAAAQKRLTELPWIERASLRKFYPNTLSVEIVERKPFALWQRDGQLLVMDRSGTPIVPAEESRFADLPFMVGGGANASASEFLADLLSEPEVASEMRAAVLVGGRRWDLHLDNGVTVKLPEKNVRDALHQLGTLTTEKQLLERDVVVVDLRLPDRVTVRLPEGRSLEDVTSEGTKPAEGKSRT